MNDRGIFYAAFDEVFNLKISGDEGGWGGTKYSMAEGQKLSVLTAFEDPAPFVGMATKGRFHRRRREVLVQGTES